MKKRNRLARFEIQKEEIETDETILREVFPVDEFHTMLRAEEWKDRERVLIIVDKWIKTAEDLPKGFMMFSTVQLPIEKRKVLIAIGQIISGALDDMDARVTIRGVTLAESLANSPAVAVIKKENLLPGISIIIPKLLQYVNDPVVSDRIIAVLIRYSKLKHFPIALLVNYLSEELNTLSHESWLIRIKLATEMISVHKLKPEGSVECSRVIPLIVAGLKNNSVEIRSPIIDIARSVYKIIGTELFNYLPDVDPSVLQYLEIALNTEKDTTVSEGREESKSRMDNLEFEEAILSLDLIEKRCKKSSQLQPKSGTTKRYLAKLTHLALDECGIDRIVNLHYCTSLRVLYLYKNKISTIEGLYSTQLSQLYLQNNRIKVLEGLNHLVNLQKLYLDNNCIRRIEGLATLSCLEELHISNQRMAEDERMTFEEASMQGLSRSLRTLNACGNNIEDVSAVGLLEALKLLNLSKNLISHLEDVQLILNKNRNLNDLNLCNNPVVKLVKYRDQVITMSHDSLLTLDNTEITSNERQFIHNFGIHKKKTLVRKNSQRDDLTSIVTVGSKPNSYRGPRSISAGITREKEQEPYYTTNLDK